MQSRVEAQASLGERGPGWEYCSADDWLDCVGNTEEENNGYVVFTVNEISKDQLENTVG
jgi:hypothetical protein